MHLAGHVHESADHTHFTALGKMHDGLAHLGLHIAERNLAQAGIFDIFRARDKADARARSDHFAHRLATLGGDGRFQSDTARLGLFLNH